tara:strand:- start:306 stop:506 length:201 start_codon:yes stop_codon:yes gene_type:complete
VGTEAINPKREIKMTTEITYSSNKNPMDLVLIKKDDSFVIVGDHEPSDEMLIAMVDYQDVEGYTMH